MAQGGLDLLFVQDNQSCSYLGVLRGLHYQRRHPQGKLVRTIAGEVFDVVVDLRRASASFGKWAGLVLSGETQTMLYVPPGFAHGFLALSAKAIVAYKCTDYYSPEDEAGLRWDDPGLGIAWPDLGSPPLISPRDSCLPCFDPEARYFDLLGRPE